MLPVKVVESQYFEFGLTRPHNEGPKLYEKEFAEDVVNGGWVCATRGVMVRGTISYGASCYTISSYESQFCNKMMPDLIHQ